MVDRLQSQAEGSGFESLRMSNENFMDFNIFEIFVVIRESIKCLDWKLSFNCISWKLQKMVYWMEALKRAIAAWNAFTLPLLELTSQLGSNLRPSMAEAYQTTMPSRPWSTDSLAKVWISAALADPLQPSKMAALGTSACGKKITSMISSGWCSALTVAVLWKLVVPKEVEARVWNSAIRSMDEWPWVLAQWGCSSSITPRQNNYKARW